MNDFRTRAGNQTFGVRATALIVRDNQIFLTKNKQGTTYYTIGGAVQVGETSEQALIREVREEVGIDIQVQELAFIVENQFTQWNTQFHNIEFHYLVSPVGEPQLEMLEDGVKQTCQWINLSDLKNIDLKPAFLKQGLPNWSGTIQHIISRD